jgi:hypothetical protein
MIKQFIIGWKTKILVFITCFHVHFLSFTLNTSRAIKKEGGENFQNLVCSSCVSTVNKNPDMKSKFENIIGCSRFWLEFVEFYPNLSTIKEISFVVIVFSPLEKQF